MSRTCHFRFNNIFTIITNAAPINVRMAVMSITLGGNFFYALGTKKEATIYVSKKYQFDRNGFTEFMIIDGNGHHYNVNNSLWYWKWDSIEDWAKIKKGDHLMITYYGIRSPLFGLFPNIVKHQ